MEGESYEPGIGVCRNRRLLRPPLLLDGPGRKEKEEVIPIDRPDPKGAEEVILPQQREPCLRAGNYEPAAFFSPLSFKIKV
jgi:hypothetical protein